MPLHEYLCQDCHGRFEAITSSAKADAVACPVCESADTRRLILVIAGIGRGSSMGPAPASMGGGGGGCCGGGCGRRRRRGPPPPPPPPPPPRGPSRIPPANPPATTGGDP